MKLKKADVTIIGSGVVGLSFALGLAHKGFSVAIVENQPPDFSWDESIPTARVSSINHASQDFLQQLDVWDHLSERAKSPFYAMHVWDDMGGGVIEFDEKILSKNELGFIVDNREMVKVFWKQLEGMDSVSFYCPAVPDHLTKSNETVELLLNSGEKIQSTLLVGADGTHSWLRSQMNAILQERPYFHRAIVAVVEHELPHKGCAYQNFLKEGPLGVLPLYHENRSAIVWSNEDSHAAQLMELNEKKFNFALTNALDNKLGFMKTITALKAIPLVARHVSHYVEDRVALIGDAAHTIHPLAGQGLNLGLRDVSVLIDTLIESRLKKGDIGCLRTLRHFERSRKQSNGAMLLAMRGFKELFESTSAPVVQGRSLGLNWVNRFDLLKQCFMKIASG